MSEGVGGTVSRRTFLKVSAATVAGGVGAWYGGLLPGGLSRSHASGEAESDSDAVVSTFCEICFWKCGVNAHVKDGRITKLEGNPKHPLSNGRLCPRGAGGVGALEDPDRLRQPLIRDGETWRPVSWDEALDFTAKRLSEVKAAHGPGSVALYSHGHGGGFFKTLIKAFGSGVIAAPSYDQCRGARMVGFQLTYGTDPGSIEQIDMPNSKCIAFIGTHLGENMHNTAVQDMAAAVDRGATFITVDPRFSVIAGKSRYWLPIKPGTDIALLLAWANVMITENLYQKDFIEKNAYGFDQFAKHVADKTPEWAYLQTGLRPALIRRTARELAKHAPASMVHPGRHVAWYGDDAQRSRAVAIVNALLGNWGKKGGFYLGSKVPVAGFDHPEYPDLAKFVSPNDFPFVLEPPAFDVCEASISEGDRESTIKAWMVYGCNVPMTLPNTTRVIEAMKQLEFVVAIDTMPAEVTGWADVILPECTYLERYDDLHAPSFREPYVAIRQPVVEPMYDTKPGWWIAKNLAEKMGLGAFFPWNDVEEYLRGRVEKSGLSFEQLKKDGVLLGEQFAVYDDAEVMEFRTPTGKVELYSDSLAAVGLSPVPEFTKHPEPPDGYFRLLFGRSPVHTFTRTTNNPVLTEVVPENELWVNTDMGKILGYRNGERVMVENQDGVKSGPIKLRLTQRIRQDCVYMIHGFGREDKRLRRCYGKGASDARLCTRVNRDKVMGGTGMNVNFVTFYRQEV